MLNYRRIVLVLAGVCLTGTALIWAANRPDAKPAAGQAATQETPGPPPFDMQRFSLDAPDSPWVVVNKHRPLKPAGFTPPLATPGVPLRLAGTYPEMTLSTQAILPLEELFAAAKLEGLQLMLASGYRSYVQQRAVYDAEVRRDGQEAADRVSARPGHSEHQTGLAADIGPVSRQCEIKVCFGELPEGRWLAANAHKHGFIIRYGQGGEAATGYAYEPWHLRYVGKELATEVFERGNPALETFFKLGAAPDYR